MACGIWFDLFPGKCHVPAQPSPISKPVEASEDLLASEATPASFPEEHPLPQLQSA